MRRFARSLASVALVVCGIALYACGDSTQGFQISGTAATGAAMANAAVTVKCASGSPSAIVTGVDGNWSGYVSGGVLPCVVEVSNGTIKLHSLAVATGSGGVQVNVNPLTEQLLGQLSSDTGDFFANFDAGRAALITPAAVTSAQSRVFSALAASGVTVPAGLTDLLAAPLVAKTAGQSGNDYDKLLDGLSSVVVPVKLIGLNDIHGNIEPPAASNGGTVTVPDASNPAGTPVKVGGAAYLATLIKQLKAKNANSIVVGAGDLIGASPFTANITHEEAAVDIWNQIGIEVSSVGNHEFDKGKAELLRMQNGGCLPASGTQGVVGQDTCLVGGKFPGASYKYLAANVTDTSTGKPLLPATYVKQFGLVSVGFIGLTLKDTPSVVTASGVAGLRFDEESAVINTYAANLKANGVNAVVVLIHQGGQTTASTINDKTCPGFAGDITTIMDKLSANVDVVVSGHTHQEYVCNYKGKLLTSTGFYGGAVTEIDLNLIPGKGVKNFSANTVPVIQADTNTYVPAGFSAVAKDPVIDAAVARYTSLSLGLKNNPVGTITASINRALIAGTTGRDESAEGTMGDVIADAYLAGGPQADIAFVNPGGVRADLTFTGTGAVTYGDLLTTTPFGNTLVTVSVTGQQLIRILEQQWEAPNNTAKFNTLTGDVGRILQPSSSLTYSWDSTKPAGAVSGSGARVIVGSVKVNGVALDLNKTYRVTTNNFVGDGGDNFTLFGPLTKAKSGVVDIDALVSYVKAHTPLSPPAKRITKQ